MSVSEAGYVLLAISALGCFLLYTIIFVYILVIQHKVPPASVGLVLPEPEDGWPHVCIVVPAHNESMVIAALAESLRTQRYDNFSVVFVLDRCTDTTEQILRELVGDDDRFEIVILDTCPSGWSGKSHAAWCGVTQSHHAQDAQMLLFTDADTTFHPECLRASVALQQQRQLGMLSLLSTLTNTRWFEWIAQPVAATELLRQNRLDRVNAQGNPKAFANGQFMLFTREAYEAIGGHESVHDALLEDILFAHNLKAVAIQFGVLRADSLVRCQMYRDWRSFWNGWKRIFTEAAGHRSWYLSRVSLKLFGIGFLLPLSAVAALVLGIAGIGEVTALLTTTGLLGVSGWLICTGLLWRLQGAPLWTVPLAPLGTVLIALLLRAAASDLRHGRGITWAGLTYERPVYRSKRKG
jgi:chlorobactene glucosyltransferase